MRENIVGEADLLRSGSNRVRNAIDQAGWVEPGPKSITGPSKLFVKGPCRFRPPRVQEEDDAARGIRTEVVGDERLR